MTTKKRAPKRKLRKPRGYYDALISELTDTKSRMGGIVVQGQQARRNVYQAAARAGVRVMSSAMSPKRFEFIIRN
jgi:hypothetical protein